MSWWGKFLGGAFGYMLGGPLGALAGAALGHNFDRGLKRGHGPALGGPADQERVQAAFFTATFSVMGFIAKADGRVTPDEIRHAEAVMRHMDLDAGMRRAAIDLFNEGKKSGFDLHAVIDQLRKECRRRQSLMQMFLEIQIQAAYADGSLDAAERRVLLDICTRLGFSPGVFEQLEALIRAQISGQAAGGEQGLSLQGAYEILNLPESATPEEIKKSYRRLMAQHHPDKLVSKGLPDEMIRLANEKTQEIRKAYEMVKKARGI